MFASICFLSFWIRESVESALLFIIEDTEGIHDMAKAVSAS